MRSGLTEGEGTSHPTVSLSCRSWLLSEGYIASLDDLPPECLVERENREEPTRTMISPPGKGSQKRTSDQLCFPSPSDQSCQSPIKEIFASPSLLGPPPPAPSVVYGPEFPVLLLLSRFSQLSDSSSSLVSPPVLKGLLTYATCHPSPSDQATRILQRLTCDPLCLGAFIRTGSICTLRARLLLQESPDGDGKGRSRHPKRARKLGKRWGREEQLGASDNNTACLTSISRSPGTSMPIWKVIENT